MSKQEAQWLLEQQQLKTKLSLEDSDKFLDPARDLVAGVDISFIKGDHINACAGLVVLDPTLEVVYQECRMVKLTQPYLPGFLAFREVEHLVQLVENCPLRSRIKVIMVDGNGILHPNGFGLASHLGVLVELPTIGVGKNLHQLPDLTTTSALIKAQMAQAPVHTHQPLVGQTGQVYGAALIPAAGVSSPIFVSVGHSISLSSALQLTIAYSRYRVPEPVRKADQNTRSYLRKQQCV